VKFDRKSVFLAFVSLFLLSATFGNSFITQAAYEQTINSDPVDPFPQAGKFYTLVGRTVGWEVVGEKNITSHEEDFLKWSVQDVVGDVAFVNRTLAYSYINPETGENYTDTQDFDYQIATNRTILSVYWKAMSFNTIGFQWSYERSRDEDLGEHTWAWFPTNLYAGAEVFVSWTGNKTFLGDMLYEVVSEEVIQILAEKQDCWMVRMPPSTTVDGVRTCTETYWVDKDTGVPLKIYGEEWALNGSSGFAYEEALVNTNIELGPESAEPPAPTYTLTVPTTPGFPEAGKFWGWYYLHEGWYMSDATNVTFYAEGLLIRWVVNVTDDEALVYKIFWGNYLCDAEGIEELEYVEILYTVYLARTTTREILEAISSSYYVVNMTSLTYDGPYDLTSDLAYDVGEETYCWLPTNLYLGANVNITWSWDKPSRLYEATYTVIDDKIICALGEPQACWVLYLPQTTSIDGTWNYSETWYSDKDVGIPLGDVCKGWAVNGSSAWVENDWLIDTNVYLGPKTYVFQVVADSQTFYIVVVTNSTIPVETFAFSKEGMKINYDVTGPSDTTGFCNVTIPMALLRDSPWTVKVGNTTVTPDVADNGTHTFLYFNYNHSTYLVEIIGTWVIPEFPATITLPLLIITTSVAIILLRTTSKRNRRLEYKP